ncbi:MAG TPA: hypothetical protein VL793_00535 [Patescibacteria group bacterium]|nr:hypothetical protein [Patescibacteria group bacterium]
MSKRAKLCSCVIAGFALIALAFSLSVRKTVRQGSFGPPVVVLINSNGIPSILGVPFGNGAVRDVVFRTLGWAGLRAEVRVSSSICLLNSTASSNVFQTINALGTAKMLPPAPAPGPSPFE